MLMVFVPPLPLLPPPYTPTWGHSLIVIVIVVVLLVVSAAVAIVAAIGGAYTNVGHADGIVDGER